MTARSSGGDMEVPLPIPNLTADGFLPVGVHECRVPELEARFAPAACPPRRLRMLTCLRSHLADAVVRRYAEHILAVRTKLGIPVARSTS